MRYLELSLPNPGESIEIQDGIRWLRMPLPFELDHINLYLLEDRDGWYVVDTGLNTAITRQHWASVIAQLSKPLIGVIVTHMHPDHLGLAGWLCDTHRLPLWMTELEYFAARALIHGPRDSARWTDEEYFVRAGLPTEMVKERVNGQQGFQAVVSPIPLAYHRLKEGQVLEIGSSRWQVMIGRGHSPEHACLYCADKSLLLAGDHVLPAISPNIGSYTTEPDANNLRDYLDTLIPFAGLPEDTLVLPAHNRPFRQLKKRVNQLQHHHHRHFSELLEHCRQPSTLYECLPVMFTRTLNGYNLYFALAECLAHLNYLLEEGCVVRSLKPNGVYLYQTTDKGADWLPEESQEKVESSAFPI